VSGGQLGDEAVSMAGAVSFAASGVVSMAASAANSFATSTTRELSSAKAKRRGLCTVRSRESTRDEGAGCFCKIALTSGGLPLAGSFV
jgi:hypothetical protein